MIHRTKIESKSTNPLAVISDILEQNRDYYLSKEEIFELVPLIDGEKIITISQLLSTIREMCRFNRVTSAYVKGKVLYAYME
jgi:hypothetical protein